MFECNCKRCNDPTEFGTYFGGIYCSACNTFNPDGEQITMKGILSKENSSQQSSDWNCNHCDSTCSSEECQKTWKRLSDNIHEALANSQGSIQVLDLVSKSILTFRLKHMLHNLDCEGSCQVHLFFS